MVIAFWLLIGGCVYGYVGYPCLLFLLSRFWGHSRHSCGYEDNTWPLVSILVAAHNEEDRIRQKIESLLCQNYPLGLYDIWLLDDGSTDRTFEIAESFKDARLHVVSLVRGGKATALNTGVSFSRGDILIFSDADTIWQSSTLQSIVRPFSSAETGAVAGNLVPWKHTEYLGFGDKIYRHYESAIRRWETTLYSAVSADGGLVALRRELWQELPQDVTDDFYISTSAVCHSKDIVFEEDAVAFDCGVEKATSQLKKRVRITVRGMTSLWKRRELFNPVEYGLYALFLISHKLIRRCVPCFALLLLPVSVALYDAGIMYRFFLVAQCLFYALACTGLALPLKSMPKPIKVIGYVLLSSYGVLIGILQFLLGKRYTYWSPEQNR
ncbi:glycosyltransferase [Desulfogranum japonicum]|uniref:glycosyltransferase n=1 Tax=Desulfogranum japonicum TaxID=231447 RepID=UPI00040CCFCF|nr:glycosyltransferase [Desulfogranum japonicum]